MLTRTDRENEVLEELVRRYSPSGEEAAATKYLLEVFREWGWDARIDEVGNVVGEFGRAGQGAPTICFLGHIDTVKGEIELRRDGQLLYGRGTVDAKGSLAAAACAAARLPLEIGARLVIVGAVEEESFTSAGARHLLPRMRPDFCIIGEPSNWDRVTLGYKGILYFRWSLAGARTHGAAQGASVATRLVDFCAEVLARARAVSEGADSPFQSLGCNVRSISSEVDEFEERATVAVDMRLPPTIDPDEMEESIRSIAGADARAIIEVVEKLPAVRSEKNSRLVRALLTGIRRQGGVPRYALKTGTSDMNIVAPIWQCPIVAYGPGDSALDHTPDEHIDLREYQKAIDVLETAFLGLV
jgi:LysW-gamma-L-lysine carboxypeptidase